MTNNRINVTAPADREALIDVMVKSLRPKIAVNDAHLRQLMKTVLTAMEAVRVVAAPVEATEEMLGAPLYDGNPESAYAIQIAVTPYRARDRR